MLAAVLCSRSASGRCGLTSSGKLFTRVQGVGLTNAYLLFSLMPKSAVVSRTDRPALRHDRRNYQEGDRFMVRWEIYHMIERVMANIYIGLLPEGIAGDRALKNCHDDPSVGPSLLSDPVAVSAIVLRAFISRATWSCKQHILVFKYRQTQLAETRLQQGDRASAATMLQTAAKTALQMGDKSSRNCAANFATVCSPRTIEWSRSQENSDCFKLFWSIIRCLKILNNFKFGDRNTWQRKIDPTQTKPAPSPGGFIIFWVSPEKSETCVTRLFQAVEPVEARSRMFVSPIKSALKWNQTISDKVRWPPI